MTVRGERALFPELGVAARIGAVLVGCATVLALAFSSPHRGRHAAWPRPLPLDALTVLDDAGGRAAAGAGNGSAAGSNSTNASKADEANISVPSSANRTTAAKISSPMSKVTPPLANATSQSGDADDLNSTTEAPTQSTTTAEASQQTTSSPSTSEAPKPSTSFRATAESGGQHRVAPATMVGLHFDPDAYSTPTAVRPGEFVTGAMGRRHFPWAGATRSVQDAFDAAFTPDHAWTPPRFAEAANETWTAQRLVQWVTEELLNGPNPFATSGGRVPVPWNAEAETGDQLGPRQWVGYSRRQVCFIVAQSLTGCGTTGYKNGLLRFMEKQTFSGSAPRAGDFGRSWWGLLAACAADPGLARGGQGPLLVAAKAGLPEEPRKIRELARNASCAAARLRVCRYDDGGGGSLPSGLRPVPAEGCRQPPAGGPGRDFMAGGLKGQATQDITAAWLGGYVFGNADGLGGGQDERLMVYFPEVSALTFFLSENVNTEPEAPQLRQPVYILGARKLFSGIDGTCRYNSPLVLDTAVPLTSDLTTVKLGRKRYRMSSSRPFLGFMSDNQGFITDAPGSAAEESAVKAARRNKEPRQRDVRLTSPWSFERQVCAWHRAVALTSYADAVQPVLRTLVKSIGAGPWLAGLWWGDSQLGLLASWIGQAVAAGSWGEDLPLDYYVYSSFTENPGNQCFVHSRERCRKCLARCSAAPLPRDSFWLPANAWLAPGRSPCVVDAADCGERGLEHVVAAYESQRASALWTDLEATLWQSHGDTAKTVFDLLGEHAAKRSTS